MFQQRTRKSIQSFYRLEILHRWYLEDVIHEIFYHCYKQLQKKLYRKTAALIATQGKPVFGKNLFDNFLIVLEIWHFSDYLFHITYYKQDDSFKSEHIYLKYFQQNIWNIKLKIYAVQKVKNLKQW